VFNAFLTRLRAVLVLSPACGSSNFLYMSLQALNDLVEELVNVRRRGCTASTTTRTAMTTG
jgi:hypothetical protein